MDPKSIDTKKFIKFSFSYFGNVDDYRWLAFYDYFERIGLDYKNPHYKNFVKLIKAGVYEMIQLEGHCFVCQKPEKILRNDKDELHSIDQPAISWKDGFELYYIDGVHFKKELWNKIITKKIKAIEILKIQNIEQRCIALKYYGNNRLFKDLNTKLISKSNRKNRLYEIKLFPDNNEPEKLLRYPDSSNPKKKHFKFVPPEFVNADEAQAWSHNMTIQEYNEIVKET